MNKLVTIIIPTLNEENYILNCLKSVLNFIIPEDFNIEIIISDGMSTDNTREIILSNFSNKLVKIIDNVEKFQANGINKAILLSKGQYIMRLDAHAIYPNDYLLQCIRLSEQTDADNCGGIVITLNDGNGFEASLVQAMTTHKFGVGNSAFRTESIRGIVDTVPFGFFKKNIFEQIGLFDERLVRCQDYEFNQRIVKNGGKIWMDSRIYSKYYNQPTLKSFYIKQFFKEAPYNPYMWYLAPYAFAIRHAITGLFTSGVILGAFLSIIFPKIAIIYKTILFIYLIFAFFSSIQQAIRLKNAFFIFILPFCFFLYHFIHGAGIIIGAYKILINKSPVQNNNKLWENSDKFYNLNFAKQKYLPKNNIIK